MNRTRFLLTNIYAFFLGNLGVRIINFLLVPLYASILSQKDYGTVDLITTISIFMVPLLNMSIHESVMRFSMDENSDHRIIVTNAFVIAGIGCLLGLIAIPLLSYNLLFNKYSILIYLYIAASSLQYIPLSYLKGINKVKKFNLLNIISALMIACLNILFLVLFGFGIKGYIYSYIITYVLIFILGFIISGMYEFISFKKISKAYSMIMLKYSIAFIPNTILWWVINSSNKFMITYYMGASSNAVFSVASKIPMVSSVIISVFQNAWQLSAIKENNESDKDEFTQSVFNVYIQILIVSIGAILVILKPFMHFYVPQNYYIAWEYVPLLLLTTAIGGVSDFVGSTFVANKDSKHFMISALFAAIINVILNLFLIPKYQIMGGVFSTLISYVVIYLYRKKASTKYIKLKVFSSKVIILLTLLVTQIWCLYIKTMIFDWISIFVFILLLFQCNEIKPIFKTLYTRYRRYIKMKYN
jgi:O-antigen/teichoic acid export membrane protein